jgi:hypothetical protein
MNKELMYCLAECTGNEGASYIVEVEVNLRPTVSRPVYLGVRRPSGTCDQFFFLFEISFRQLRVYAAHRKIPGTNFC